MALHGQPTHDAELISAMLYQVYALVPQPFIQGVHRAQLQPKKVYRKLANNGWN